MNQFDNITHEQLKELYYDKRMSVKMIADYLNVNKRNLMRYMRKIKFKLRTSSKAQKLRMKLNRGKSFGKGKNHLNWRGGKFKDSQGYIEVSECLLSKKQKDLFKPMLRSRKNHSSYILEHRLIMARHLGRPLLKNEVVHHLNGFKDDNRWSNLLLLESRKHFQYIPILNKKIRELELKIRRLERS